MHRPQTAHWLWTSQPEVIPNEYPEFGLQGRGGRIDSWYGIVLVLASFLIQIASLMFWLPLEIHQMETLGYPTFVIALRFRNIAAFALGKMDAWGLRKLSRKIREPCPYHDMEFSAFPASPRGAAPAWLVDTAFASEARGGISRSFVAAEDDAQARIAELKHFITAK